MGILKNSTLFPVTETVIQQVELNFPPTFRGVVGVVLNGWKPKSFRAVICSTDRRSRPFE